MSNSKALWRHFSKTGRGEFWKTVTHYGQISDLEQNRPAQIGLVYSPTQPNHSAQNQKSNSKAYGQVTDIGLKAHTRWYESM